MAFEYWRISRFPELSHLTAEQRHDLIRRAGGRRTYTRIIAQGLFIGVIFGVLVAQGLLRRAPTVSLAIGSAVTVITAVLWYQFILWRMRITMRVAVMDGLEGERVPVCLKCGYNVERATEDRCPECGAPLRVPTKSG